MNLWLINITQALKYLNRHEISMIYDQKKFFVVLAQVIIVLWLMGLSPLKFILKGYCGAKSEQ
jgi:hypothetical protein